MAAQTSCASRQTGPFTFKRPPHLPPPSVGARRPIEVRHLPDDASQQAPCKSRRARRPHQFPPARQITVRRGSSAAGSDRRLRPDFWRASPIQSPAGANVSTRGENQNGGGGEKGGTPNRGRKKERHQRHRAALAVRRVEKKDKEGRGRNQARGNHEGQGKATKWRSKQPAEPGSRS